MSSASSNASFSHQFYQHWAAVPDSIRAAIVQELSDIDTLLQPETPTEQFEFSQPNLDAHLDNLYGTQSGAAAEKDNYSDATSVLENSDSKTLNHDDMDNEINDADFEDVDFKDTSNLTAFTDDNSQNITDSDGDMDTENIVDVNVNADAVQKPVNTAERFPKTPKLVRDHEDLIHELGIHIDDYLSDQMTQLSEDLKSWLRAEISRQLEDKA